MPPKKSAPATATDALGNGSTKFTWEGANDFKLLVLTQGRHVKPDEFERLASAFSGDTTAGSIRNRLSKLRVQQRTLYEEYGWALPEVGNANANGNGNGNGTEPTPAVTPAKSRSTPKKKNPGNKGATARKRRLSADVEEQGTEKDMPRKKAKTEVKAEKSGQEMEIEEKGSTEEHEHGLAEHGEVATKEGENNVVKDEV